MTEHAYEGLQLLFCDHLLSYPFTHHGGDAHQLVNREAGFHLNSWMSRKGQLAAQSLRLLGSYWES